jgi:hypothetical protein
MCRHISGDSNLLGFEVLKVAIVKNIIFWDVTPCSPGGVHMFQGNELLPSSELKI